MLRSYIKTLLSPGPKYSLSYSLLCIALSILVCIPPVHWLLFPEAYTLLSKKNLPIRNIFLVSSSPYKLSVILFSELLGLSADHPTSLQQFSTKQAEMTLRACGVFSSLSVQKAPDNKGIIIFYSLHTPLGYLGNQTNTLINSLGERFPCQPFFKSLNLPKIFFSQQDIEETTLPAWKIAIADLLIKELQLDPPEVIDVSCTEMYPMEIVVTLRSGHLLRLHYHALQSGLENYRRMQASVSIEEKCQYIYDLRFPYCILFSKQ